MCDLGEGKRGGLVAGEGKRGGLVAGGARAWAAGRRRTARAHGGLFAVGALGLGDGRRRNLVLAPHLLLPLPPPREREVT